MFHFASGETVQWRYPDEKVFYTARYVKQTDEQLALRLIDRPDRTPVKGREIILRVDIDDYHTQVLETSDDVMLYVRPILDEQRRYFRVDDYFPIIARKSSRGAAAEFRSRVIPVFGFETAELELPETDDENLTRIWRALHGLNNKLSIVAYHMEVSEHPIPPQPDRALQIVKLIEQADFRLASVMEELGISRHRLARAENKRINISATGIRFITTEPLKAGDYVDLRLLLPTEPPTGIVTRTRVVRADDLGQGRVDVALDFADMDAGVQDLIVRYAMDRQRELVKDRKRGPLEEL